MTDTPATDGGGIDVDASDRQRQVLAERGRDEAPSEAVVRVVSDLTGTDPLALEPLYHAIDPDVLDAVFRRGPNRGVEAEITIQYNGCEVTITHDTVQARRLEG